MESEAPKPCPVCGQNDTIAVETLYFALLESSTDGLGLDMAGVDKKELYRRLAPPQLDRRAFWQILKPDVLFGAAVLLILITTVVLFLDQRPTWFNSLYLILILAAIYALLRKRLASSFEQSQTRRAQELADAQPRVDLWSTARYCFKDGVVFGGVDGKTHSLTEFFDLIHA